MITIKNESEIAKMKRSGQILALAKQKVYQAIKAGISTNELNSIARAEILKHGAKPAFEGYGGFPATCCISINDEMIHGIPGSRTLVEGDLVKIDMGAIWKGYYSDSAFTKGVGKITQRDQKLILVAKEAFARGLAAIKPGKRVGDISYAIGKYVRNQGMFVPNEYTGHGIGLSLHEEPDIFNEGPKGTGALLKDGMTFAIEPMILQGSNETVVKDDGWTVVAKNGENTAHYEHTVLIKNGKGVILTGGI